MFERIVGYRKLLLGLVCILIVVGLQWFDKLTDLSLQGIVWLFAISVGGNAVEHVQGGSKLISAFKRKGVDDST